MHECKWKFKEGDVAVLSTPRPGAGLMNMGHFCCSEIDLLHSFGLLLISFLIWHFTKQPGLRRATILMQVKMALSLRLMAALQALLGDMYLSILGILSGPYFIFMLGIHTIMIGNILVFFMLCIYKHFSLLYGIVWLDLESLNMLSCVKYQTSYEFACGFHVHDYYYFF